MSITTPVSAATPTSAMKPTATATDKLNPSHHISHTPPTSEKGTESMMIRVSVTRRILELPAPGDVIAGRELDLRGDRLLGVGNISAEVPVTKIDIDITGELGVLGANARRPWRKTYFGDLSQWDGAAI